MKRTVAHWETRPFWAEAVLVILLLVASSTKGFSQPSVSPAETVADAVSKVCGTSDYTGLAVQALVPGSWLLEESRSPQENPPARSSVRLVLPDADELLVEVRLVNSQVRQFRVSYFKQIDNRLVPHILAIADGSCTIRSARKIRSGEAPWMLLDQLEGDLATLRWTETLQAPWPEGVDNGGVRVALIDSGLAYDLPLFTDRLARTDAGVPIGYDFWDMDPWPYDGDTSRGAFLPIRHGTAVASILAREAPDAALVPYRYPRPDMTRLKDIVERAVADGVRILAMPLGSNSLKDWQAFADAMKDQNILAIVSAGNNGRDIDANPVYPASLTLDNMLTVTSADGFGRLAEGSNWGRDSVDIMLPAENVSVTDFRGASGVTSGSSYAVPRLAALAARILKDAPDLTALELRKRVLARARPSPYEKEPRVKVGWIPDPAAD